MLRQAHHAAGNAAGKGDPIMTGFGGRAFEFLGQPGSVYSLLSEKFHKVSTSAAIALKISPVLLGTCQSSPDNAPTRCCMGTRGCHISEAS